jgi:hypothetical protein
VAFWLTLGALLMSAPAWLSHLWLPWHQLSTLPVLREILPDQIAPFVALFIAFVLAIGLDAFFVAPRPPASWRAAHRVALTAAASVAVALLALVPVFVTFDVPFRVVPTHLPPYLRDAAPALPAGTVLLTVPFAISGSAQPMLWQAVDEMHFRLAGAALKTPGVLGGPVGDGAPGSARRILYDLTLTGSALPAGTPAQLATIRRALAQWQVEQVVIAGTSRDPIYTSGFFTMALGVAPTFVHRAWVWTLHPGTPLPAPVTAASLPQCRAGAQARDDRGHPLAMARCVLASAGVS